MSVFRVRLLTAVRGSGGCNKTAIEVR